MSTNPRYCCEVCGADPGLTIVTIHRTSPKGELFRGRCEGCLGHAPDPEITAITDLIEDNPYRPEPIKQKAPEG